MIDIRRLSFAYPGVGSKVVLDDISIALEPGFVYGLMGQNGVGKSTLFRLLSGANPPSSGEVRVLGCTPFERQPFFLQNICLVPEDIFVPSMSLSSYGEVYGAFYPKFSMTDLKRYALDFDISLDKNMAFMSMGQRKKAAISFALATNARILLLDEPTNGMDIPSKRFFRSIIAERHMDDSMIIVSTHQIRDIEPCVTAAIIVHDRRIILCETVKNLLAQYRFGRFPEDEPYIYAERVSRTEREGITRRKAGDTSQGEIDLELLFEAAVAGVFDENGQPVRQWKRNECDSDSADTFEQKSMRDENYQRKVENRAFDAETSDDDFDAKRGR